MIKLKLIFINIKINKYNYTKKVDLKFLFLKKIIKKFIFLKSYLFINSKYLKIYKNTTLFENRCKYIDNIKYKKRDYLLTKKNIKKLSIYLNSNILIFNNRNIIFQDKNIFYQIFSKKVYLLRNLNFFFLQNFKYYLFFTSKNFLELKFLKPNIKKANYGSLPRNFFFYKNYSHKNFFFSNYAYNKDDLLIDQKSFIHTKFNQQIILNFLESFFKKKFFLKNSSNYIKCIENYQLKYFILNNKYTGYSLSKYFDIKEFIEIIWYSLYFRDLNMLSVWVSKTMEKMSFKNHKKFVMFFQNFFFKNSTIFLSTLGINGFFFDIRGKVGVTGSSKKRHISFKIGILNRSSKKNKIEVNQKLVRTYAGVLGLTYIMSY